MIYVTTHSSNSQCRFSLVFFSHVSHLCEVKNFILRRFMSHRGDDEDWSLLGYESVTSYPSRYESWFLLCVVTSSVLRHRAVWLKRLFWSKWRYCGDVYSDKQSIADQEGSFVSKSWVMRRFSLTRWIHLGTRANVLFIADFRGGCLSSHKHTGDWHAEMVQITSQTTVTRSHGKTDKQC
jgi:hypothetical protein